MVRRFSSPYHGLQLRLRANRLRRLFTTALKTGEVILRDYQEECIRSVISALQEGHKRLGVSLATGSGKTVIFTQLIDRVPSTSAGGTRTLVVAHRKELVEQAASQCLRAHPAKSVEIEMASSHASGTADITVASLQSITSSQRLHKFDPASFKLILVDEAHHIVAPNYMRLLKHFGLESKNPASPALVGLSATFSRFDGLRLGAAIDQIVYHRDYVDMIGEKWLSDVIFTTVKSTVDLSRVPGSKDGFYTAPLSKAVNTEAENELAVRSWRARASNRRSTLVFCVDVAHVVSLTQKFRGYGVDARYIVGDTPPVQRRETMDAFRQGRFPVLLNCGVFTEGTDIPNTDCIVLARPTKSRNLLVQMIGRGMRLHPSKENCHVIDMVSSLETGVVTTPTLFGLDPEEIVDKATVADMRGMRDKRAKEAPSCSSSTEPSGAAMPAGAKVTFTDYESLFDLLADTSGEKHIRQISRNSWVQVGQSRYILSGSDGSFLRIEQVSCSDPDAGDPTFRALEVRRLPKGVSKSPFAAPRQILAALTLGDAVRGSDQFAAAHKSFPHNFISRYERWRTLPPTDGQLAYLNRFRSESEPLTQTSITKGRATDMITKLKHGARGHFTSLASQRNRQQRALSKLKQDQNRKLQQSISVGPVTN